MVIGVDEWTPKIPSPTGGKMSKAVTSVDYCAGILLDCGHQTFIRMSESPSRGDEIACPVCPLKAKEIATAYQKGWDDKAKQVMVDIEEVFKT